MFIASFAAVNHLFLFLESFTIFGYVLHWTYILIYCQHRWLQLANAAWTMIGFSFVPLKYRRSMKNCFLFAFVSQHSGVFYILMLYLLALNAHFVYIEQYSLKKKPNWSQRKKWFTCGVHSFIWWSSDLSLEIWCFWWNEPFLSLDNAC